MFGIGIPTLNRYDLLKPTLERYVKDFPGVGIFIVDNGKQKIKTHGNVVVVGTIRNIGVAASWNLLCGMIFRTEDVAIILNDDIYLGVGTEAIVAEIMTYGEGFFAGHLGWCAFAIRKETYEKVGKFDERFHPAYFEDNDYGYRLLTIHKIPYRVSDVFTPKEYRVSSTIEKNPELNIGFERNKKYYIKKWGGEPGHETYLTPFNQ